MSTEEQRAKVRAHVARRLFIQRAHTYWQHLVDLHENRRRYYFGDNGYGTRMNY